MKGNRYASCGSGRFCLKTARDEVRVNGP